MHILGINLDIEAARSIYTAYHKEADAEEMTPQEGREASPPLDRCWLPK
jgi:hypothetical protein